MGEFLDDMDVILRAAGLHVRELRGWKTRGRSNNSQYQDGRPWCIMWHHTASNGDGESDADYCTFRSPIAPVTNIVLGRGGIVYLCAAGPTNTNGKGNAIKFSKGTVPKDSMNTYALAIEISNGGTGMPYPQAQVDAAFTTSNALTAAYGLRYDDVANHFDYSPGRKIDCATAQAVQGPWQPRGVNSAGSWSLEDLRSECRHRAKPIPLPGPTPIPDDEDDMIIYAFREYANTWSQSGVHLSPEAFNELVAQGAKVVVSELTWPENQHLNSLMHISGIGKDQLVPK